MGNLKTKVHNPFLELHKCDKKSCSTGEYLCKNNGYCIDLELVCNNVKDCFDGDDEDDCGSFKFSFAKLLMSCNISFRKLSTERLFQMPKF